MTSGSTVTWAEVKERVYALGAGLVALGVGPEDRVALASATRYEWALADLAVMVAGGVTTTIYPTTIDDDVAFILATRRARSSSPRTPSRWPSCAASPARSPGWPRS